MGVGRAGIFRRFGLQQQAPPAQHLKKTVPPQPHSLPGQGPLEHEMQLARPQARLDFPFFHHQRNHQAPIHLPQLPGLPARVIILTADPQPAAHRADVDSKTLPFKLYGLMPGWPPAFFLNASTSVIPARRHARRVYARSSAASMFASASALSNFRTRSVKRLSSFISPGFSTRITFPLVPLPYWRTHLETVIAPLIPYFIETASKASPPASSSRTTSILKASLYRISTRLWLVLVVIPDNLFQDGTPWFFPSLPPSPKGRGRIVRPSWMKRVCPIFWTVRQPNGEVAAREPEMQE